MGSGRKGDDDNETTRLVWRALCEIHKAGHDRVGPTMIVRQVQSWTARRMQTTLVSSHLRTLVEQGRVERLPQGPRKALYRVVEGVGAKEAGVANPKKS